ncbi:MAG: metallophosphoesterase family protein [Candidatus Latescibacteria bacterium]|jgi:3',5'-cyclic AMP phosphodiesterase CpdA|nr:metallophosphoesterase family protein [Candidatus Latescibacterota bacterium]
MRLQHQAITIWVTLLILVVNLHAQNLPIYTGSLRNSDEIKAHRIRNMLDIDQLSQAITDGTGALYLDFKHITSLLDGTEINYRNIHGVAAVGPYPFEAAETEFVYKRFRQGAFIQGGSGVLDVGALLETRYNSEGWTDTGQIVVRLNLSLETPERDRDLGLYDILTAFKKEGSRFVKKTWIQEGPFVNRLDSRNPTQATISLVTDTPTEVRVILNDERVFLSLLDRVHELVLTDLTPDTDYTYLVQIGDLKSPPYRFRTPPEPGSGNVTFAFSGDSREGVGGGQESYMGVNYQTIERLASLSYAKGAELFLFGGDLIIGYTTNPADFRGQLYAWKQALSGFWHERPVYPGMGNHDALLKAYRTPNGTVRLDRWPYNEQSAETVFANAFTNPTNGPAPSNPQRPPYLENVYTIQHGPVRLIAYNNNYWYTSQAQNYGGCPEGYIMDDQMKWIEAELEQAEQDSTVHYVFLYAQEPVFPCGGHSQDAMWYNGDNAIRAYTYSDRMLKPEPQGLLEMRNRFARAVATSSKVAAVLGGDEHAYYRVRIDASTPVGNPETDDANNNDRIDWKDAETPSPLTDLKHPVWYITCGGGGAPYYAEEKLPWNAHWQSKPNPTEGYLYSSQENVLIFSTDKNGIGMQVYNPHGELIDTIPNLMDIKN